VFFLRQSFFIENVETPFTVSEYEGVHAWNLLVCQNFRVVQFICCSLMFCMWFWLCNICCKLYDRQYNCISYRLVHHAVVIINGNHLNWLPCKNGSYCQRAGGPSVINYSLITARLKCNRPVLHRSHIPLIFFTPSTRKVYQQSLTSYSAFFWKILNLRRFILIVLSSVCILSAFLPCDAMLARVLANALCLSVCLSQVGILLKRLNKLGWFLAWELPSTYHKLCYKEIRIPPKKQGTSFWNFAPNSGLRKFCYGISIVEMCYRLSSRGGRSDKHDKLDCCRSTRLTISSSSDTRLR